MSAFVVEHRTINRIVTLAYRDAIGRASPLFGGFGSCLGSPTTMLQCEDLGIELLAMNQDAVMARYPEAGAADLPGPVDPPPYAFRAEPSSLVAVLKSARCLRYQCTEGPVPETALYRSLDDACQLLAEAIVGRLQEYEDAAWE